MKGLATLSALAAHAIIKTPTDSEDLLCFRAKSVTLSCDPPQTLVIDGELVKMNPVTFTTLPGALSVLAPPKAQEDPK